VSVTRRRGSERETAEPAEPRQKEEGFKVGQEVGESKGNKKF